MATNQATSQKIYFFRCSISPLNDGDVLPTRRTPVTSHIQCPPPPPPTADAVFGWLLYRFNIVPKMDVPPPPLVVILLFVVTMTDVWGWSLRR
jgi:hypothetical protein